MSTYRRLEDLDVYGKLCRLHIEVCVLAAKWPAEEKYELGSQVRRSSNSSPAQLAEKYDDRHVRNKIEGVNRSRGEAAETIHHLYMARLKGYEPNETYERFRERYQECIRMLNGIERTLEKHLPERDRRWPERVPGVADEGPGVRAEGGIQGSGFRVQENPGEYHTDLPPGYPEPPSPELPNPDP